jgi:NAD+ synthase (glutamine-hydrolysing)
LLKRTSAVASCYALVSSSKAVNALNSPSFFNPYAHGFLRLGVAVPPVRSGDVEANCAETLKLAAAADAAGAAIVLFPELGISAYAIDDLHLQETLLDAVEAALARLVQASETLAPVLCVGAALRFEGRLYNCGLAIQGGRVLGVVPKTHLPNYREFYERRWFASGAGVVGRSIEVAGQTAPFGVDLLFQASGSAPFTFHLEICEDVWVPQPPSSAAALAGAELLLNLSASNIVIGKAEARRMLCASQSARCLAAYAYSAAGPGESTTDLAWDGHASIFELGVLLGESERFHEAGSLVLADVDVGRIRQERIRTGSFGDTPSPVAWRTSRFDFVPPGGDLELLRTVERFPYVPADPARLAQDCEEAYQIQVQGLAQRLRTAGLKHLVIGVSGGLDSTQALLVSARVMDRLGLPRANIYAYTMPGFATSDATKSSAWKLMQALGVTAAELDIRPAAQQMLADIGHPFAKGEPVYDVTFENVQAGLRTDFLFRLANQHAALVVGTGDLSELGLGWCTYGVGDHMSHYNPNGSVSKTLIQHLIRYVAHSGDVDAATADLLEAILATEISPELVPASADGAIQATEQAVGPYALQDFNLFYLTRYGFRPSKIAYLAWNAWQDAERGPWPMNIPIRDRRAYSLAEIKHWLRLFLKRFFANQFKRTALPNGPKMSSGGSLSPRGDWRMPSDAASDSWLIELEVGVPRKE